MNSSLLFSALNIYVTIILEKQVTIINEPFFAPTSTEVNCKSVDKMKLQTYCQRVAHRRNDADIFGSEVASICTGHEIRLYPRTTECFAIVEGVEYKWRGIWLVWFVKTRQTCWRQLLIIIFYIPSIKRMKVLVITVKDPEEWMGPNNKFKWHDGIHRNKQSKNKAKWKNEIFGAKNITKSWRRIKKLLA